MEGESSLPPSLSQLRGGGLFRTSEVPLYSFNLAVKELRECQKEFAGHNRLCGSRTRGRERPRAPVLFRGDYSEFSDSEESDYLHVNVYAG